MTSERIKEIQQQTAYPDSISVQQALLQVWNECSQLPQQEKIHTEDEIECDYCNKRVKKFMAIDTWMITEDNKNVCYGCQIKNNIGWGEIKIN
jgi:hypothetical protein